MTGMEQAITQFGYLAVFAGAVFEGETALLAGAMAAGGGLLDIWGVALAAWLGGCSSDLFFYFAGLIGGNRLFAQMPVSMAKSRKIRGLISVKSTGVILASRFAYGLRSVIPLACSVSGVRPLKFVSLDLLSGIIWAVFYSVAGAGLGEWLAERISHPRELWLPLACLAMFALALIAAAGLIRRRLSNGAEHGRHMGGKGHDVP